MAIFSLWCLWAQPASSYWLVSANYPRECISADISEPWKAKLEYCWCRDLELVSSPQTSYEGVKPSYRFGNSCKYILVYQDIK